ncbi:BfmA/BtgA family mobilization protein [Seonamhaeicola marinus]|uniref:Uncharacterized protein n=1 Tax=Seonamhaeicola marinus TaxID=1912246 RepID=A0A5D0J2G2_9FLAO|nr:BfmA/BtgA family mobilization protein [Seonamhaeicola marinus]TYA89210.1 hypothetical protein FUA24_03485 [Seonamhaeicola marinus]
MTQKVRKPNKTVLFCVKKSQVIKFMDTFSTIRFKIKVANRFRKFSKQVARNHTQALEAILDFFEIHQLSPRDTIDGNLTSIEIRIKRRINAAIAIIKDIEKSQTLPTVAMLQSLFEQQLEEEANDGFLDEDFEFIEKKFDSLDNNEDLMEETTVPKIRYLRLEEKMEQLKTDFKYVLGNVKEVKSHFGKDYLKLELSLDELEKYKRTLNNL